MKARNKPLRYDGIKEIKELVTILQTTILKRNKPSQPSEHNYDALVRKEHKAEGGLGRKIQELKELKEFKVLLPLHYSFRS